MPLAKDVRKNLQQAIVGADSWYAIYSNLRDLVSDGEEQKHRALIWAFGYDLTRPDEVERREREGSAFGAMFEFESGRLPPRIAEVPDDEVEIWAAAFDEISDDWVRSRIGDLLWERRYQPRPDRRARTACEALLNLADAGYPGPMESTEMLMRAVELSRSVGDENLLARAVRESTKMIEGELTSGEDRPGIPFSLLEAIAGLPPDARPESLIRLIEACEERYGDDPFHLDTSIDLRAGLIGGDGTADLRRRQVKAWRDAAGRAEGLVRLSHLQRALELARVHGLKSESDDLRIELESISEEDLDLKEISAEVKVPREKIDQLLAHFLETDGWESTLRRFGAYGPPGGEIDQQVDQVKKQMAEHPLQFLVTKVVIDPDLEIPIFRATDDQSHEIVALAEGRRFATTLWSLFATEVLEKVEAAHGRPSVDGLTNFFTSEYIDEPIARRIAASHHLWWDGSYDECAHLLVPRIEAAIRETARRVGVPIINEPTGAKPGGVRTLGGLLSALEGHFASEGWRVYLHGLLSDPLGANLRNIIAHGLRPTIGREDAALLLHAVSFLRLLGPPAGKDSVD